MSSFLLDLDKPRTVLLEGKDGKQFRFLFDRITDEDWRAFYDDITISTQRFGIDVEKSVDFETASLTLFARAASHAEGYTIAGDPSASITAQENWKQLIPVAHRLRVSEVLAGVHVAPKADADESVIHLGGETMELACTWYAEDTDSMVAVSGLKHLLNAASEAQHRRYARDVSRTRILGGSRAGMTIFPGAQATLASLYDELIVSVEGYAVSGSPLSGRDAIAREMDMHHKVVAAQAIFEANSSVTAALPKERAAA